MKNVFFSPHVVGLLLMLLGIVALLSPASTALETGLQSDASGLAVATSGATLPVPSALASTTLASTAIASTVTTSAAAPDPVDPPATPGDPPAAADALLLARALGPRGFDPKLLITFDVRCDTSGAADLPRPARMEPYNAAGMLQACRGWWRCDTAGELVDRGRAPRRGGAGSWSRPQYDACRAACRCAAVDAPARHYAANFGCPRPQGGWVAGGVGGLSSRDGGGGGGAPVDIGGGFAMQAYRGPARAGAGEDGRGGH